MSGISGVRVAASSGSACSIPLCAELLAHAQSMPLVLVSVLLFVSFVHSGVPLGARKFSLPCAALLAIPSAVSFHGLPVWLCVCLQLSSFVPLFAFCLFWGGLRGVLGCLWEVLGALEPLLGDLGSVLAGLGRSWGDLGATFQAVRFRIDFLIEFERQKGAKRDAFGEPKWSQT